jgi:4-hydroxy-2-oxoheptanedioate aldolase
MSRLKRVLAEQGGPIIGAGAYFYDPVFVEICAGLGFRAAWFDMEHCHISLAQAADLCRVASGQGLLTMIRIPDASRENVLRAAECGPDMLDVPMANTPDVIHDLVRYARFRPEGERGCFGTSRALGYGLHGSLAEQQRKVNEDLCLMAQIETEEAVARAEELCAIPGVDLFIGPLDLSSSLGVTGDTGHPRVREAAGKAVAAARRHGKNVAVACSPPDFAFWAKLGVDVLYATNNVSCLKAGALAVYRQARLAIEQKA